MLTMTDTLILILTLSGAFAIMCAIADYAIPSAVTLRRRRVQKRKLAPMMSEEWK